MMGELSGLSRTAAIKRAHEVLHYVDLGESRYRTVDGYSAGMRQRLKLAAALAHDPDFLLLDEPTNGLDPQGRRFMLDLIAELSASGIGILVSTHLLPDVQEVCQTVVVVSRGRVVRRGTVAELTRGLDRSFNLRLAGDAAPFLMELSRRRIDHRYDPTTGEVLAILPAAGDTSALFEAARDASVGLKRLRRGTRSLEEVFLETIERDADAGP
jgi:ABC-2 type transport system ATP-binding protein